MSKKKNTIDFIKEVKKIYGDSIDFSKTKYFGSNIKSLFICRLHGEFWQRPNDILNKHGCPKCGKILSSNKLKYDTNKFIEKAKLIHGDKYDYSKVEYKNSLTKVCIVCPEHGEFYQEPSSHIRGYGCRQCAIKCTSVKRNNDRYDFIWKSIQKHGYKYDYRKSDYTKTSEDITIICPVHGEFKQVAREHIRGYGCPKCGGTKKMDKDEFIEKANKIHNNKYDYTKVEYINNRYNVDIICPIHGVFKQTPHAHLSGQGCPFCKESKLEKEVALLLDENNIKYERQKRFKWLGKQSLDFYLPEYNIGIECQGIQHFKAIDYFGGEDEFKRIVKRDIKKRKLCLKNFIDIIYYSNIALECNYEIINNKKQLIDKLKQYG